MLERLWQAEVASGGSLVFSRGLGSTTFDFHELGNVCWLV